MSTSSSLLPPLPFLPPLPDVTFADLSSYGKNEVTFTVQSRLIGFKQRVHSACTGALMRALKIRPSTMESNEPTTVTSAPSSTPTISSPMPLGAGNVASISLLCPAREATCATEIAHGESSIRAMFSLPFSFPDSRLRQDAAHACSLRAGDHTVRSIPPARRCQACQAAVAAFPSPWCSICRLPA